MPPMAIPFRVPTAHVDDPEPGPKYIIPSFVKVLLLVIILFLDIFNTMILFKNKVHK
jgi:hypothetical protein